MNDQEKKELRKALKSVSGVVVSPGGSTGVFKVTKKEVLQNIKDGEKIDWFLSDDIYKVKRTTLVIF